MENCKLLKKQLLKLHLYKGIFHNNSHSIPTLHTENIPILNDNSPNYPYYNYLVF